MTEPIDQLAAANAADVPVMASPHSGEVQLLRGVYVEDTQEWHDTATVTELTGSDEEYLTALSNKANITYTDYMTGFLERAVLTVGSLPAKGVVNKLILPDRDMLFLAIVKATYGDEREVTAKCPVCEEVQNIIIELDTDFPVLGMDRDFRSPLSVSMSKGISKFRHPNGEDTAYATGTADSTSRMNTLLIASTVLSEAPLEERIAWALDLSLGDRRKVDLAIMAASEGVGPQLDGVKTRCVKCEEDISLRMDWVSLLLG
jgi:hypothetical protein